MARQDGLKLQRGIGLALAAAASAFEYTLLQAPDPSSFILAHCAAAYGVALYSLTMTGRASPALAALVPVPVLSPLAAVWMAWRQGHRSGLSGQRVGTLGEVLGLALALGVLGGGGAKVWESGAAQRLLPAPKAVERTAQPVPRTSLAQSISYRVPFFSGTDVSTRDGAAIVARVADTMHYYPLDDVQLLAPAPTDSAADTALAARRAEAVKAQLVRQGLKPDRVRTRVVVRSEGLDEVDILIVEGG